MPTDPLTVCLIGIGLSAIGWLIVRDITQSDKRKERIAQFLRDMWHREQEIIKGLNTYHYAGESFSQWKRTFIVEAKALERDFFWRRWKFKRLVRNISDMQPGEIDDNTKDATGNLVAPKKLLAAIQKLIAFLE